MSNVAPLGLQGVAQVDTVSKVDHKTGLASVMVDAGSESDAEGCMPQLMDAVAKAGYKAEPYASGGPQPLEVDTVVDP